MVDQGLPSSVSYLDGDFPLLHQPLKAVQVPSLKLIIDARELDHQNLQKNLLNYINWKGDTIYKIDTQLSSNDSPISIIYGCSTGLTCIASMAGVVKLSSGS